MGFEFAVATKGIYFEDWDTSIRFLSFASGKVTTIRTINHPLGSGLSVSSDERYLLYTQLLRTDSDLMLVENFK